MNNQRLKMKMQQKLTPQQLLLMRLLQLPVTRLEQQVKEEMEKNPMLEIESEPSDEAFEPNEDEEYSNTTNDDGDFKGIDIDEYFDDDYSYREQLERDHNTEQRQYDFADGTSFIESLMRQLDLLGLNERDHAIGNEIIGSIDGTGYLGRDTQLIANDLTFRSGLETENEDVERVLKIVQTLDPAGIAARNLQECLSLQLHRIENPEPATQLATTIVDKYFSHLSNKHYAALMTILKIDEKQLNAALAAIRRLNPKPGWGRDEENRGAHYIIPDFIVSHDGGELNFTLSSRNRPRLRINSEYAEMMQKLEASKNLKRGEQETLTFIREKTNAAQMLIDTIDQRQETLAATMGTILKYQQAYFLSGDSQDLRPMRLKEIADATGLDESTISRIVNEKYVQTEFGTFPLKDLFSKAVVTEQGEVLATEHIKEAIAKAIDNEDKNEPLTDDALTAILQKEGFRLSRRTVTKYRESMGIPVGRLRKELNT